MTCAFENLGIDPRRIDEAGSKIPHFRFVHDPKIVELRLPVVRRNIDTRSRFPKEPRSLEGDIQQLLSRHRMVRPVSGALRFRKVRARRTVHELVFRFRRYHDQFVRRQRSPLLNGLHRVRVRRRPKSKCPAVATVFRARPPEWQSRRLWNARPERCPARCPAGSPTTLIAHRSEVRRLTRSSNPASLFILSA